MDDIIAVRVRLDTGEDRYFLTWGRVFDRVDSKRTEELVLTSAKQCNLGGQAVSAHLCYSLRDASAEEYFYESLFAMACTGGPQFGPHYNDWAAERRHAMEAGREIWYLGKPRSRG